jgi:small subunit ribosomal protein S3
VIGKKGEDIENLKADLQRMMKVPVHVNIEEIRKPETDAQLIADSITQQLERRIMFRRAMKRAMQNAMRLGALGIKLMSSGRLNGAEIARTEWYREGRVPLHTLRADIEYGFSEANTTYGIIGVKCWVYKGDTLGRSELAAAEKEAAPADRDDRRGRRPPGARPPGRTDGRGDGRGDSRGDGRGEGRGPRADAVAPGAGAPVGAPGGSEGRPADRQRVRRAAPAADAVKSE